MVNFDTQELGRLIGGNLKSATDYKQDFIETEEVSDLQLFSLETVNVSGSYFITSLLLSSDAFYLNHPVYGMLDDENLLMDGTYASSVLMYSGLL